MPAQFGFTEEADVRVRSKNHVACLIGSAIGRVYSNIVQELVNASVCVDGSCSLSGTQCTEHH